MNTTKYCPQCEQEFPAEKFASMDKQCPCKACQREISGFAGSTSTGTPFAPAIVRRRFNARHADKTPRKPAE